MLLDALSLDHITARGLRVLGVRLHTGDQWHTIARVDTPSPEAAAALYQQKQSLFQMQTHPVLQSTVPVRR
jgi:hypothetical protein